VVGPSLLLTFCWAGTPAFEKEEKRKKGDGKKGTGKKRKKGDKKGDQKRGQIYFHDLFTLLEYKSVPFFPLCMYAKPL
jgi:hypothetical protein